MPYYLKELNEAIRSDPKAFVEECDAAYAKKRADAAREQRRAAREAVLTLLFETEYHEDDTPEAILARAAEARIASFARNTSPSWRSSP